MLSLDNVYGEGMITRELVLTRCSDYDIFKYYIGEPSRSMKSPLRKDSTPSFSVYHSKYHNKLLFKDHGTGDSGDCFVLVQKMFNLNLSECLIKINTDLKLGLNLPTSERNDTVIQSNQTVELPTHRQMSVRFRKWAQCDTDYWTKKYNINEQQLRYYKVYPIDIVFFGEAIIWTHTTTNPMYTYIFFKDGEYTYKVYRPLSPNKEWKWLSSTNRTILQGWDQLPEKGDLLILTKSLKDVILYRTLGYYALSCQSETSTIKDSVMDELKARFKTIVINQDNDPAGRKGTEALAAKFNLPYFYLTEAKDISDYRELHTKEETIQLIKDKLNELER